MGLYDWIIVEIECPNCKKKQETDFQTYDLGRTFNGFNLGDEMENNSTLRLLSVCSFCHCVINAWGNIENGKLKNIEIYSYKINLKKHIIYGK